MKNTRLTLAALFCGMAVLCALGVEVATNAVKLLPERNLKYADAWVAETEVAQGAVMKYGNNFYMAVNAGLLGTNAPAFRVGSETNGVVLLRYIKRGPRRGFAIQLHDAGPVWVSAYAAPIPGEEGFLLSGNLGTWTESGEGCPQGSIWVASASGTNTLTATEW